MIIDVLLFVLAIVCAPAMVYGIWSGRQRAKGIDVMSLNEVLRVGWLHAAPWVLGVLWVSRKILAPARDHGPAPWVDYVKSDADEGNEIRRDLSLSDRLSALSDAQQRAILDIFEKRGRVVVIDALVAADWQTGEVRAVLKGDNGVIGQEVESARQRLGVEPTPRFVTIAGGKGGKVAI